MYTQQNSGQYGNSQENQYWEVPRPVTLIRFTKVKANRDGQGSQRGALIRDDNGQERWVSEHPNNQIFKLNWNSRIFYNGKNARPSLTQQPMNQGQAQGLTPPTSQYQADSYARQAEPQPQHYSDQSNTLYDDINSGYRGPSQEQLEFDNNYPNTVHKVVQNGQPSNTQSTVDELLIEKISLVMANCMLMSVSLNPQLDVDNQTKLAISAAIQYFKAKEKQDLPF